MCLFDIVDHYSGCEICSYNLFGFVGICYTKPSVAQALSAALAAGARRRSLATLATPPPSHGSKRPLKKSPDTVASTASPATVTPDPKRLMTSSEKSDGASSGSKDAPMGSSIKPVPPVELFPHANGAEPMDTTGL